MQWAMPRHKDQPQVLIVAAPAFHVAAAQKGLEQFGRGSIFLDQPVARRAVHNERIVEARLNAVIEPPVHKLAQRRAGGGGGWPATRYRRGAAAPGPAWGAAC